ncbi:MAG TPA: hypothetical protein VJ953_17500 [Saprospiraceae bacterium]|nr:hypothetical protein [Saprospiraceae bacterium]
MQQRLYFSSVLLMVAIFTGMSFIPESPVPSFQTEVFPLIQQKCAIPTCHGVSQRPYFTDYESIEKKASRIEKRITHPRRPMPPANADVELSAVEQQLILDWIVAGAPNN